MRFLLVVIFATTVSSQLAPLLNVEEPIPGRYIIKLKEGWNMDDVTIKLDGAKVLHRYRNVFSGFAADLSDRLVQQLRKSDAVEYIQEDGVVYASTVDSWGLDRVDQIDLPLDDTYNPVLGDGDGVSVYVLDTGINLNHTDFVGRSSYGLDTHGGTGEDCNGHGSHCAGTIGGTRFGVAKAVKLIGVRVLSCQGTGSFAQIIEGCDWVAENATLPAVASMSLGGGANQATDDAIQRMIDVGITVVVAAGNSYSDACRYSPARSEPAITVGATDITDTKPAFSNHGTCLDIFAPGVDITSAWYGVPNANNTISGTSMACPHVAGAAAVLLANDNELRPQEVKEILQLKSIADAVSNAREGSPNLLLYIGEGSGGGFIPTPPPPTPSPPPTPPPPGCGGYHNSTSGTFSSPNYPRNYDNNMNCEYLVSSTDDERVMYLAFDEFNLENHATCNYDSLTIYDGSSSSAPLLGKFCGTTNPGSFITAPGGNLFLVFQSDGSITTTGFSASHNLLETGDCGHTFTTEMGFFSSPNYPSKYGNHADCSFTIHAITGQTITLSFSDFDIEDHTSCGSDAVEVYDGDNKNGVRLANLCGSTIPQPVTSTKSSMFVWFISDSSITSRGFRATYSVQ